MMTVRQRMEHDLWGYDLQPDDIHQAMPVIIRQINSESHTFIGLAHKDNPEQKTPIKDCWDIDEKFFTEESVENLSFYTVKSYAFRWCIQKINSMK